MAYRESVKMCCSSLWVGPTWPIFHICSLRFVIAYVIGLDIYLVLMQILKRNGWNLAYVFFI